MKTVSKEILDRLIPAKTVRCRQRPSDPWFDTECREAKRELRRLERSFRCTLATETATKNCHKAAWFNFRKTYRQLLRRKRQSFWCTKTDSERQSPRRLWDSIDTLMGRGRPGPPSALSPDDLLLSFSQRAANVHTSTGGPPPTYTAAPSNCAFSEFRPLTFEEVSSAIFHLPNKQSCNDTLPTTLLKEHRDLFTPFIAHLFNTSLASGIFPTTWKTATVTPVLKKGRRDRTADTLSADLEPAGHLQTCLLYTSPSPRDLSTSRMPSSA